MFAWKGRKTIILTLDKYPKTGYFGFLKEFSISLDFNSILDTQSMTHQTLFPELSDQRIVVPFKSQLLKWIGNKQRFAHEITSYFPNDFRSYREPFLGSGAVLGTLRPAQGFASDVFSPLMEIWSTLHDAPSRLKRWYRDRWNRMDTGDKTAVYEEIKASYNHSPNGADLLFLCRSCYGGVVRFRKSDGFMSTPCGVHRPINPESFSHRVDLWKERTKNVSFFVANYRESMREAKKGDLIYCDPPYCDSQTILYGAQEFRLNQLFEAIELCRRRGVYVALSIDGQKDSGGKTCAIDIPSGLFVREVLVNCGPSMLKRFQMEGQTLERHRVSDRLLLTY